MRLGELAAALSARLTGDPELEISRVAPLETAGRQDLGICIARRHVRALRESRAGAVLVLPKLAEHMPPGVARLEAEDSRAAFHLALRLLHRGPGPALPAPGVDSRAAVDSSASLAEGVRVGPFAVIGAGAVLGADVSIGAGAFIGAGAHIGARTHIAPRAVVLDACVIGADCQIGPGAVVGSVGFGLDALGRVPHVGRVVIEDLVSLGANTCVDRATLGETRIERGAQIDNLVQIGHNAHVGAGAVLCGQVGLAGGARIEAGAVVGGQSGIAGHVVVGRGARIAAQSGVTRDLGPGGEYSGHPAEPNRPRLRRLARLKQLAGKP